jgi:hypothetical protein
MYIVGSYNSINVVALEFVFPLPQDQYCIEIGTGGYKVNLRDNEEFYISRVYKGNASGKAERVDAYVYRESLSAWVNIETEQPYTA